MPTRFAAHTDIFTVIIVHLSAIGITFLHVENTLKVISLLVATGYTVWKWVKEWKKTKK